jgi:hypothetical protein
MLEGAQTTRAVHLLLPSVFARDGFIRYDDLGVRGNNDQSVGTMTSPFTTTGVEFTSSFSSLFVRLLQIVSPVLESRQCKKPLRSPIYALP